MIIVHMGNEHALDVATGNAIGRQISTSKIPDDYSHLDAFAGITSTAEGVGEGAWIRHSTDRGPAWIECSEPALGEALAAHYGCPLGRPTDWPTPEESA